MDPEALGAMTPIFPSTGIPPSPAAIFIAAFQFMSFCMPHKTSSFWVRERESIFVPYSGKDISGLQSREEFNDLVGQSRLVIVKFEALRCGGKAQNGNKPRCRRGVVLTAFR